MHEYTNIIIKTDDEIFKGEKSEFASRLSKLVKESQKSQDDIIKCLKVSRPTLWSYCEGKAIPNTKRLLSIAREFNVTPDYLLGIAHVPDNSIGLSTETMEQLKMWGKHSQYNRINKLLDFLVSNSSSENLRDSLCLLIECLEEYKYIRDNEEMYVPITFFEENGKIVYGCKTKEEKLTASKDKVSSYTFRIIKEFSNIVERYVSSELGENVF